MNLKKLLLSAATATMLMLTPSAMSLDFQEASVPECGVSYSISDCSQVPGIILSSNTNPDGIVEIKCENSFAITSCSANADPGSPMYKHWQGLARCVPFSSRQTNCSSARVGAYDVTVPVIKIICPANTHADCDYAAAPMCACIDNE